MLAICSRSVSRSKSALKILSSKFKEIKLNTSNKNLLCANISLATKIQIIMSKILKNK